VAIKNTGTTIMTLVKIDYRNFTERRLDWGIDVARIQ